MKTLCEIFTAEKQANLKNDKHFRFALRVSNNPALHDAMLRAYAASLLHRVAGEVTCDQRRADLLQRAHNIESAPL